ncbi:16S rRNA (uracil(1498)-N(3))-methyltransferase [Helicobacter pametensis]|uniref:16S rRNA (uracil(1498)-N(3))-methyltransferase n=1 Tax=Helicobacter pametensis TaxID=95149 RepID=UPI000484C7D9|nr:16S rRNA (uracil(1498)-N(3))-methyltransferase [Helicobacter pametensis]
MQFLYHPNAGDQTILIQGEQFIHLYKSRRTKHTQVLYLRNLCDDQLYQYKQTQIDKKSATLTLHTQIHSPNTPTHHSHIILARIDSKSLQKALPFLNELGLSKLTLFFADYSQRNEKLELDKIEKILINSSQQCGRSDKVQLEILENLDSVLMLYPQIALFDFGGRKLTSHPKLPILIGPEGGFSPKEKERLRHLPTYSTQESMILRSESACIYVASLLQALHR